MLIPLVVNNVKLDVLNVYLTLRVNVKRVISGSIFTKEIAYNYVLKDIMPMKIYVKPARINADNVSLNRYVKHARPNIFLIKYLQQEP
jgi:hypothetical protein